MGREKHAVYESSFLTSRQRTCRRVMCTGISTNRPVTQHPPLNMGLHYTGIPRARPQPFPPVLVIGVLLGSRWKETRSRHPPGSAPVSANEKRTNLAKSPFIFKTNVNRKKIATVIIFFFFADLLQEWCWCFHVFDNLRD